MHVNGFLNLNDALCTENGLMLHVHITVSTTVSVDRKRIKQTNEDT